MNGYGAPTELSIYGVPASTWATWSQFTKDKYMQQYVSDVSNCFTHGDGRTTCYNEDTGTWEMLAYTYTYGVDELTGLEGEEIGETFNEVKDTIIDVVEDLPEDLQDIYEEGKDYATIAILIGVAALLSR